MSQPDDVYEEASTSMKDYVQNVEPLQKQKKQRRKRRLLILLAVIIVAAGGIGYWFMNKPSETKQPASTQQKQPVEEESDKEVVETTENHVSQNFRLVFDYPSNWEVDESDPKQLLVSSPTTKFSQSGSESKITAKVVVTVRAKNSQLPEFTENSAALRESEKMAYAQPSGQQRGQTYLTFVSHSGGLEGVYVTGDNGYEKDGFVPRSDVMQADPVISVRFIECPNKSCDPKAGKYIGVDEKEWETNKYLQQAKKLLESLVIS
jgi:hypothetical protein